mmetsp:Transcript_32293/g.52332  ORF Transcript_32293/g.52332 Transcript_32293/m.52332 type:complete len:160 (-) Transcript_32293:426-905(-)
MCKISSILVEKTARDFFPRIRTPSSPTLSLISLISPHYYKLSTVIQQRYTFTAAMEVQYGNLSIEMTNKHHICKRINGKAAIPHPLRHTHTRARRRYQSRENTAHRSQLDPVSVVWTKTNGATCIVITTITTTTTTIIIILIIRYMRHPYWTCWTRSES